MPWQLINGQVLGVVDFNVHCCRLLSTEGQNSMSFVRVITKFKCHVILKQ